MSSPVTVAVRENTISFMEMPDARVLRVTAVIRNRGARTVYMSTCGPSVEREILGQWESVWAPGCLEGAFTIPPEDSLVMPVAAYWHTDPRLGPPTADQRIGPGRYRIKYRFGWHKSGVGLLDPLPAEIGISHVFTVTSAVTP
jgi:hypothetical protein